MTGSFTARAPGATVPELGWELGELWRSVVETITVAATRSSAFSLSEMEMLIGSAIVVAVLVWMVLSRVRRDRNQPHA